MGCALRSFAERSNGSCSNQLNHMPRPLCRGTIHTIMAQNLLIRELDEATNQALDRFKEGTGLKANTDAALAMINDHWRMAAQIETLLSENLQLRHQLNELTNILKRKSRVEAELQQVLAQYED